MDYSQNPELMAHFENPNLSDILMEIFQPILKTQSFGIFRESEYPFLRDARGDIPGPCTFILAYSLWVLISVPVIHTRSTNDLHYAVSFRISSSIESASLGVNYLTLSIVSLNQMFWRYVSVHVGFFWWLLPLVLRPVVKSIKLSHRLYLVLRFS